jgi:hypothetical protein
MSKFKQLIIFAVLIAGARVAYSQNYDSLVLKMDGLEANQIHIQKNLTKSHKQHQLGTRILIGGAAISALGLVIYNDSKEDAFGEPEKKDPTIMVIGSLISGIGAVIQIDSHKWIGKAGKRKRNKNKRNQ